MPRTSTRRLPRSQPGIQSFARATKPNVGTGDSVQDGKKVREVLVAPASTSTSAPTGTLGLPVSPSKKRKLSELENVNSDGGTREQGKADGEAILTPSKSLRFSALSVSSPRSGHYASPRDKCSTRIEEGEEEENVPSTPSKRATTKRPDAFVLAVTRQPCVEELVKLHSAFLKALTIFTAHHGVAAPADLREFLPSVERIWKKRKVVVKDLQRLLWIWGTESGIGGPFRLANHGLGRVCLEWVAGRTSQIDEAALQSRFEQAVDMLWEKALDAAGGDKSRVDFPATLGLASIIQSLAPFTAFRKGQQRLQDLKGGVIKVKTELLKAEANLNGEEASLDLKKGRDATTTRRQGLLDRIKNKELRQAKLPPPPSKEMLLRRAAAGRVEEVAGVLALLRPAGYVGSGPRARMATQRTPFCLGTIVRNVQDSTRNPISDKEVEACLEILSRKDVAGHWVSIVVVNQLKSVVLRSSGDVQLKEIGAKVCQLGIGWEGAASASKLSN